jgi:hypothetical protein
VSNAHFTNMTDEQRYKFTTELWMLWQMRYRVGGPLLDYSRGNAKEVIEREIWIAQQLGYRHAFDQSTSAKTVEPK